MAFITQTANYGYEIAELFGTPKALLQEAKALGVGILSATPGEFVIHLGTGAAKQTVAKISLQAKLITLVKANQLGPSSKNQIEDKFSSGLKQAIAKAKNGKDAMSSYAANDIEATSKLSQAFGKLVPAKGPDSLSLKDATQIGQIVGSTSPGSKYVYFARHDSGLKFALRMKGNTLSLRCEGPAPALATHGGLLKDALGFDLNEGYCSVHLKCPKPYQALKAVGCLLAIMGNSKFKEMSSPDATLNASLAQNQ